MARFSARVTSPSRVMIVCLAEARFDQVGQPEHAAEAVRVRIYVRDEDDSFRLVKSDEKTIRPAKTGRRPGTAIRVGAATRHVYSTSIRRSAASWAVSDEGQSRDHRTSRAGWEPVEELFESSRGGGLQRPDPFYPLGRPLPSRAPSMATQVLACKMEKPATKRGF